MISRLLIISVLPLYILLSTGLSLRIHYCHGELKSISLSGSQNCCSKDACDMGGGKKCAGCLDEELIIEPIHFEQINTFTNDYKIVLPQYVINSYLVSFDSVISTQSISLVVFSRPPPLNEKIYLAHHQLTYYG
ncbi:MAG: HYC_CC_PP family protein [Flavobacteriales bacterium]